MHLIVDGYNVLFAIGHHGRGRSVADVLDEARQRLLPRLVRHHQQTGDSVTVIFDSNKHLGGARNAESLPGVAVRYTAPRRTADDEILALVGQSSGPQHLRVVTSDRELGDACRRGGADVVGAMTFYRQLGDLTRCAETERTEHQLKTELPDADEVREFLDLFGGDLPPEDPR